METRWGLGPVFAFEWLTNSRRWQVYALRSLFVACLLAGITLIWSQEVAGQNFPTIQSQARVGQNFYSAIVNVALALVLLAAPAATAGAICLDKARGTLDHLLATDLSDAEIVLGKLGARLIPTLGMVCCAAPVMALGTLLGGMDPNALLGAFLVIVGVAILGSALALTLSVWGRKTHEVLMATYVVWVLWMLSIPIVEWIAWRPGTPRPGFIDPLKYTHPFYLVLAPYNEPGAVTFVTFSRFLGTCLLLSLGLAGLAVVRLRRVALRQASQPVIARRGLVFPRVPRIRLLPSPSLDGNPVLWREWHRKRPSRLSRVIWGVYVLGAILATVAGLCQYTWYGNGPGRETPALVSAFVAAIGMLLLSVSAATSLAEERVRGSLDVLLATPLSTSTILWGKWWGTFRTVPRLVLLPLLAASFVALDSGRWGHVLVLGILTLTYGAGITSLGLALATWCARLGRAVALTVAAYVLVTVAWVFLVVALFPRDNFLGPGLAMGSPFFGVAFGTLGVDGRNVGGPRELMESIVGWELFWHFIHGLAAAGLFAATLATFDACLGRVTDGVEWRPVARPRRTKPVPLREWEEPSVV